MTSFNALTQYTEVPAVKALDLSPAGMENLLTFGADQRQQYLSNAPFPHLVVDDLFSNALLQDVLQDVTSLNYPTTESFDGPIKEFVTSDPQAIGPTARQFLLDLCSARFCLFLEALTDIEGVIPDPHFEGGGVHEMARDGFSKMQADLNGHKKLKLDRRLNMLIYLNPDWDDRWGGQLDLWDGDINNQSVKVPPAFNKTVIFSTTDCSFHGSPSPLTCPKNVRRRSLSLSYYSSGRPAHKVKFHQSTSAIGQPMGRTTKKKSGTNVAAPARAVTAKVKKTIKKSLPKPLMELYRAGKRSLRG